jgi:hypothetical protein
MDPMTQQFNFTVPQNFEPHFGYIPDLPDHLDYKLRALAPCRDTAVQPPNHLVKNFLTDFPNAKDQGRIGSCVANSSGLEAERVLRVPPRSRLQIYYDARKMEGTLGSDTGCYIRDAMKVISANGAGSEDLWPYDTSKYNRAPPRKERTDAAKHKVTNYYRLETRDDFRRCLLEDYTFVCGITVYDYFVGDEAAKYGIIGWPQPSERSQGGHAVLCYGYDDNFRNSDWAKAANQAGLSLDKIPEKVYIFRNSWGNDWGHNGDFAIDARYIESNDLCGDAWTQRPTT